jgi:hypothetical protein
MNTTTYINIVDLHQANNEPRVILFLPAPTQTILPNDIVLQHIGLLGRPLGVSLGITTQSQYFFKRSVQHPFGYIQLGPCIFTITILRTQILKNLSSLCITMVIIKFRANGLIVTTSFSSPLFATSNQAKVNSCNADCAYIVRKLMNELQQLDNVTGQKNDKSMSDCRLLFIF